MRMWIPLFVGVLLGGVSLSAQTPAVTDRLEASVSVHALRREDSARTWSGGGVGASWNLEPLSAVGEITITRRDGHNDWRGLAGPRVSLLTRARTQLFAQVLAGTLIRQQHASWSVQLGVGADIQLRPRVSLRLLVAGLRDHTARGTLSSGRTMLGVVVR